MPLALESGTATVSEIVVPILVAVLTAAGALIAPRLNAAADDLKRAEQLTTVLEGMTDSPERDYVRHVRDDHATAWALSAAAPRLPRLRIAGLAASSSGILVLVVSAIALFLAPGYQWWFWAWYLLAAVLLAVGGILGYLRSAHRRDWMAAERRHRGLGPPIDARRPRGGAGE